MAEVAFPLLVVITQYVTADEARAEPMYCTTPLSVAMADPIYAPDTVVGRENLQSPVPNVVVDPINNSTVASVVLPVLV